MSHLQKYFGACKVSKADQRRRSYRVSAARSEPNPQSKANAVIPVAPRAAELPDGWQRIGAVAMGVVVDLGAAPLRRRQAGRSPSHD